MLMALPGGSQDGADDAVYHIKKDESGQDEYDFSSLSVEVTTPNPATLPVAKIPAKAAAEAQPGVKGKTAAETMAEAQALLATMHDLVTPKSDGTQKSAAPRTKSHPVPAASSAAHASARAAPVAKGRVGHETKSQPAALAAAHAEALPKAATKNRPAALMAARTRAQGKQQHQPQDQQLHQQLDQQQEQQQEQQQDPAGAQGPALYNLSPATVLQRLDRLEAARGVDEVEQKAQAARLSDFEAGTRTEERALEQELGEERGLVQQAG